MGKEENCQQLKLVICSTHFLTSTSPIQEKKEKTNEKKSSYFHHLHFPSTYLFVMSKKENFHPCIVLLAKWILAVSWEWDESQSHWDGTFHWLNYLGGVRFLSMGFLSMLHIRPLSIHTHITWLVILCLQHIPPRLIRQCKRIQCRISFSKGPSDKYSHYIPYFLRGSFEVWFGTWYFARTMRIFVWRVLELSMLSPQWNFKIFKPIQHFEMQKGVGILRILKFVCDYFGGLKSSPTIEHNILKH